MAGSRRQFSREFKVEAVRQVLEGGRPLARVARELDISASVLRRWKQKFEEDPSEAFPGNGRMKAEDEELRRLRKEVVRLRLERYFLKNTAVFFAGESR
jgi:transposase